MNLPWLAFNMISDVFFSMVVLAFMVIKRTKDPSIARKWCLIPLGTVQVWFFLNYLVSGVISVVVGCIFLFPVCLYCGRRLRRQRKTQSI